MAGLDFTRRWGGAKMLDVFVYFLFDRRAFER